MRGPSVWKGGGRRWVKRKMQDSGRKGDRHTATSGKPRGFQGYMSEWEAQGLLEKEHICGAVLSRDMLGDNSLVQ